MNLITIVEPAVEPVSVEDMHAFLRLDALGSPSTHPDDGMLATMITSARQRAEQVTRRAFVQQTVRLVAGGFPCRRFAGGDAFGDEPWIERDGWMELPRPPFVEIVAVRHYDTDNTLQTLSPSAYFVSTQSMLAVLHPVAGEVWPETYRREDAVQVDYIAGYPPVGSPADLVAAVPAAIKDAIKIGVQLLYDELQSEKRDQLEATFQRLLTSYRVHKF